MFCYTGLDPVSGRKRKKSNTWIPAFAGMTVVLDSPMLQKMTSHKATIETLFHLKAKGFNHPQ